MAVVEVLHSRTASDPLLMHLLRCLVFYAAVHHFGTNHAVSPGSSGSGQTQLGISRMDIPFQGLLDQGIARSTKAVYRSGWKRYSKFCQEHSQPPLPLSEHTLCQFAAVMLQEVTWKTICIYLSALRFSKFVLDSLTPLYLPSPALPTC